MAKRFYKKKEEKDVYINLSSFIDILFVLLIAFMIPSHLIFGNIELSLPTAEAEIVILAKDPIKISIDKNSNIFVNEEQINLNNLVFKTNEVSLKNKNIKIYVIADKNNNYGFILNIVNLLNKTGYRDVVLITDLYGRI